MNLIQHYDEDSDLEFEIPEFDPVGHESIESFLETQTAAINEALTSAIYNGIEVGIETVPAFAVEGVEEIFCVKRSEFAAQIQRLTEYYSGLEEFELCTVLQELKNKL